jgi:uncharacterized RDD family membrane protein YckC
VTIATPPSFEPAGPPPQTPVAYASFSRRVQALLADFVVGGILFALTTVVGELAADVPGMGRAFVIALVIEALLYEPILVWRFGGTVGHRHMNLRVVDDRTGGNPSFLRALARWFLKSILGILSFAGMALTRRYQAVHDRLTHTTVQIRDFSRARPWDYHFEREPVAEILPPAVHRVFIIFLYLAVAFIAFVGAIGKVLPSACTVEHVCSTGQEIVSQAVSWLWLGGSVACVILGWRGRLFGARARPAPASIVPEE